ncbi:FHA domain-containing protein [Adlercreutzia caecimuris]|nr:FHA domain-containing protein [Adlercreutzia caecimuris]
MSHASTPAAALFELMKRRCGISHKELASIVLSGRPLADGRSPASRVSDRTWVSRFVVHARPDTLQEGIFADFSVSALRLIARMKSQRKGPVSGEEIVSFVRDEGLRALEGPLAACAQPVQPLRAVMDRIDAERSLTADERAEEAMVLLASAACTAESAQALEEVRAFTQAVHVGGLATPPAVPVSDGVAVDGMAAVSEKPWLGLLRMEEGRVAGSAHWVAPEGAGAYIGSLAAGDGDVSAVSADVSGCHARVWRDEAGAWRVEDLGSRNGTAVTSTASGERGAVEPGGAPCELHPGDLLHVASTTFAILEGYPG